MHTLTWCEAYLEKKVINIPLFMWRLSPTERNRNGLFCVLGSWVPFLTLKLYALEKYINLWRGGYYIKPTKQEKLFYEATFASGCVADFNFAHSVTAILTTFSIGIH